MQKRETVEVPPFPKTIYAAFGIDEDAHEDQVKKAWRRLALSLHPDKGGDADEFTAHNRWYKLLMDAPSRRQYDAYLARCRRPQLMNKVTIKVNLDAIFGNRNDASNPATFSGFGGFTGFKVYNVYSTGDNSGTTGGTNA